MKKLVVYFVLRQQFPNSKGKELIIKCRKEIKENKLDQRVELKLLAFLVVYHKSFIKFYILEALSKGNKIMLLSASFDSVSTCYMCFKWGCFDLRIQRI